MFLRRLSTGVLLASLCVSLGACSRETTLKYTIKIDMENPADVMALIQATERVMKRRVAALGEQNPIVTAVPAGSGAGFLTIELKSNKIAPRVKQILAEPFTFDIRMEKPAPVVPGQPSSAPSEWVPTGITKDHVLGVRAVMSEKTKEVAIELNFTPTGLILLSELFKNNKGKNIGIFMRDLMVSSLEIQDEDVDEHIIISGLPDPAIAPVFSDDVNVGLYVHFTPVE